MREIILIFRRYWFLYLVTAVAFVGFSISKSNPHINETIKVPIQYGSESLKKEMPLLLKNLEIYHAIRKKFPGFQYSFDQMHFTFSHRRPISSQNSISQQTVEKNFFEVFRKVRNESLKRSMTFKKIYSNDSKLEDIIKNSKIEVKNLYPPQSGILYTPRNIAILTNVISENENFLDIQEGVRTQLNLLSKAGPLDNQTAPHSSGVIYPLLNITREDIQLKNIAIIHSERYLGTNLHFLALFLSYFFVTLIVLSWSIVRKIDLEGDKVEPAQP